MTEFGNKSIGAVGDVSIESDWRPEGTGYIAYYWLSDDIDNKPYLDVDIRQPEKIGIRVSNDGIYWIPNPLK